MMVFLVYNDNGVIMNEGNYRLYTPDNNPYYYSGDEPCWFDIPFNVYVQFPLYIMINSLKVNVLIMNLVK